MKSDAFEDYLLDEAKILFKYLLKIGATKEDAEDIVQDTLFKTIINIDSISEEKIRSWIFKVGLNSYYNLCNKNHKRESFLNSNQYSNAEFVESTEGQFMNQLANKDIYRAMDKLKPSYKKLLLLKYYLDFSYKDIARIMATNEKQIKVYMYRARNKFKNVWEAMNRE